MPGSPDKIGNRSPTLGRGHGHGDGKQGTQGEKNAALITNILDEIVPELEDKIEEINDKF